ncbi:hypothetical protein BVRB_019690 [Beta vulgaris subsp. vulgaris]|uniref:Elongation Factor G domain-containing protein n=1 Tax=Beta vulgaris subsp. vulgaris TaxID=3555 RepID=A0A0J7YLM4_BETVV|nr:hypothetical protein BVRB_019690 [Beta vulgaris subsp. vulgaris]
MNFPEPVIEIAIEPKSKADQEKLGVALAKMVAEDPSFTVHTDQESGQTIMKGMGELHLDIKVDILKRTYKVEPTSARRRWPIVRAWAEGRHRLHAQEADRRYGPVRPRHDHLRAGRAGFGLRVRKRHRRRRGAEGIHPGRPEGPGIGQGQRPAGRLPADRLQGDPDGRQVPRRRLVGPGLRNRLARRLQGTAREGRSEAARADHEGRGRDAGRIPGLGHRRSEQPPWHDPRSRHARQRHGGECLRAAGQHVRLREHPAGHVARPRPVQQWSTTTTTRCRNTSPTK